MTRIRDRSKRRLQDGCQGPSSDEGWSSDHGFSPLRSSKLISLSEGIALPSSAEKLLTSNDLDERPGESTSIPCRASAG